MRPVERRRNEHLGDFLFVRYFGVGVMEKNEDKLYRFHRQHNVGIHSDQNDKKTFVRDFDEQIDDVKSKACSDVKCLIAVMNLVESPEELVVMTHDMPQVDAKVVDQEGEQPLSGAFFHTMQETVT